MLRDRRPNISGIKSHSRKAELLILPLESKGCLCCRFQHFVWLTSAVRGPYLPAYLEGAFSWYRLFTAPLAQGAKLVGATISCAPLVYSDTVQLQFPHVQQVQNLENLNAVTQQRSPPGIFPSPHLLAPGLI